MQFGNKMPLFSKPPKLNKLAMLLAASFVFVSAQASAGNAYTIVRGAAQGGSNYTIYVTGDDIHSLHVTGVNATGWTIDAAGEHLFGPPDWSPSIGLSTGFGWTANDGNIAPAKDGFHFSTTDFSHDYTNSLVISVDFKDAPDKWYPIPTVPEPATLSMLVAGLGLLGLSVKRRTQS